MSLSPNPPTMLFPITDPLHATAGYADTLTLPFVRTGPDGDQIFALNECSKSMASFSRTMTCQDSKPSTTYASSVRKRPPGSGIMTTTLCVSTRSLPGTDPGHDCP